MAPKSSFSQLPSELKTPDEAYAWWHIAKIILPLYALLLIAGVVAAGTAYPWLAFLTLPFIGAQIYKITIIMHDCCHGTMFRSRTMNNRIGALGGYFVGTDFDSFRKLHWRHHSRYGETDDPQGDDYLDLDTTPRAALTWHVLRPLTGYNLYKLFVFSRAPRAEADTPTQTSLKNKISLLFGIGMVQLSLAAAATLFGAVWWTAVLYPVAAATFALFFSQARGFAEHVAMPGQSPVNHARTHLPNWVDKIFFYDLNFNYHIEHHSFPSVPSCHLPRLHETMKAQNEIPEMSPSITGTIARRLRAAPLN